MSTKKVYFVRYFKSLHLMFPYLLQIGLEVVDKGSNIVNQSVPRFIEIFFTGWSSWVEMLKE